MKRVLISFLIGLLPLLAFGQSDSVDPNRCSLATGAKDNCWATIEYPNGQRFVGMLYRGKPSGDGILYFSDGVLRESGRWSNGEIVYYFPISKSRFPFDDNVAIDAFRSIEVERERNRPPEQKIAFCVQTVRVETRGTTFPSISVPYCQDACNKTYSDRMCGEVGGSKWRVQATSPKTSPPNSSYFAGMGTCSCVGQEYVLNEIKETPPPAALPAPTPASAVQADLREAELAKREKALAERERALLEAENKRLRDELEAERKKKK